LFFGRFTITGTLAKPCRTAILAQIPRKRSGIASRHNWEQSLPHQGIELLLGKSAPSLDCAIDQGGWFQNPVALIFTQVTDL
jgi:hypothetical protein